MHKIAGRKYPHFQARCRNDFQTASSYVVRGYRAARGILLPGHVIAELLDQQDVSCDNGRDKVRLIGANLVHFTQPGMHPIVLIAVAAAGIALTRTALTRTLLRRHSGGDWWPLVGGPPAQRK